MGILTTSSETLFTESPEEVYEFVTNPTNWTKTYPGSAHVEGLPGRLPLEVGDTWTEAGKDGERIFTWQLAMATAPKLWVFTSVGRLGHKRSGEGGQEGRITVEYHFSRPGGTGALFRRTMTIEAYKDCPMPDDLFRMVNPANIDKYHAAIARELQSASSRSGS